VSTTGEDADWVVKLIDEFPGEVGEDNGPGGRLELVRSEIFRGRYRNGYDRPEPFVPGEVTRVEVPLQDVLHTFARGHRVVVQVQSTLFPFFDRNPQSWVENIYEANDTDFVAATHRVHHGPDHPTALRVGVLED
jgi:predicted acyl esterase